MTDMASFMTKLLADNGFAAALNTHLGSVQDGDAEAALCSFARDHGYQVTVKDIEIARKAFAELNEVEGDLSDDDLNKVSGGLGGSHNDIIIPDPEVMSNIMNNYKNLWNVITV